MSAMERRGVCPHCGADRDGIRAMLRSNDHDRMLARALLNECSSCREAVGLYCELCGSTEDVHWYYIGGLAGLIARYGGDKKIGEVGNR